MSPNPTVEKTVTLKYKASVRVSGSVKLAADARSITKYVEANSPHSEARRSDHEQDRDSPVAGHDEVPEPRYKWLNPPVSSFDMGTVTGCLAK